MDASCHGLMTWGQQAAWGGHASPWRCPVPAGPRPPSLVLPLRCPGHLCTNQRAPGLPLRHWSAVSPDGLETASRPPSPAGLPSCGRPARLPPSQGHGGSADVRSPACLGQKETSWFCPQKTQGDGSACEHQVAPGGGARSLAPRGPPGQWLALGCFATSQPGLSPQRSHSLRRGHGRAPLPPGHSPLSPAPASSSATRS